MANLDVNLANMTVLVADANPYYRQITTNILRSFGAEEVLEAGSTDAAKSMLEHKKIDILFCDAELPTLGGFAFVRSIRMNKEHPRRSIPILITAGVSRRMDVSHARDCGAHILLKKPISPTVVYDRLAWIAHTNRPFWESESYYGPDRRVRDTPQDGLARRKTDMTQDEIDEAFDMEHADDAA